MVKSVHTLRDIENKNTWNAHKPDKWDTQTALGFWVTSRLSNLGQATRPRDNQQKNGKTVQ